MKTTKAIKIEIIMKDDSDATDFVVDILPKLKEKYKMKQVSVQHNIKFWEK